MSSISLTLRHSDDEYLIDEVASNIDAICDITGCRQESSFTTDGAPTKETVSWLFTFKNENQEECARSMLLDLIDDYPYLLTMS
jgi:hypothetical protein